LAANLKTTQWAALRRVGAVIEEPAFYPYLSGRDNLEALARAIGGIPRAKIAEVLERVDLQDRARDHDSHVLPGLQEAAARQFDESLEYEIRQKNVGKVVLRGLLE